MMTARARHPIKEIEAAVQYAELKGWSCVKGKGHAWGILRCPWNDTECRCGTFCQRGVWSTPRVPENMAEQIKRAVDGCVHLREQLDEQTQQTPSGKQVAR